MYAHQPRDYDDTYGGSTTGYGDYSKQGGHNEFEYPVTPADPDLATTMGVNGLGDAS
jgi:hypothetical protein